MAKDRQLANDLIQTNSEYQKLKGLNQDSGKPPRETPGQQGPGRRGYDKEMFDELTQINDTPNANGIVFKVSTFYEANQSHYGRTTPPTLHCCRSLILKTWTHQPDFFGELRMALFQSETVEC